MKNSGRLPFGQLPVLESDGEFVSQGDAVLRYVGMLAGLYQPNDVLCSAKVDEVLGIIGDIKQRLVPSIREEVHDNKAKMRSCLAKETLPWYFERFEATLRANDRTFGSQRGFCVGNKPTIADLALVGFLGWFEAGAFIGIHSNLLDDFPRLRLVGEAVSALPPIYKWRQDHPTRYLNEGDWVLDVQGIGRHISFGG
eukprot:NODE_11296_length_1296_cov_2.817793.p1 GENE.NODE_11296_length_1296_cov_2.817793~~NODE_11296_length_1296_cov_2.817793.p1  ORF type:complete len:197 (+),score=63.17 NODE_11296_length_1296_cov_2.817793:521-1111(+)